MDLRAPRRLAEAASPEEVPAPARSAQPAKRPRQVIQVSDDDE